MNNVRPIPKATNERSEATRRRLIEAGMSLFGINGFEATTTRALADAAGANLAAIPYHFGGKDGLYRAVAQAVVDDLGTHMDGFLDNVQQEIDAGITSPAQATSLIESMMNDFSQVVLINPESENWMTFLLREQMDPTEAFTILYDSPIKRMRGMFHILLGKIMGLEPDNVRIKLLGIELLGLISVFRVARASTLREMGWAAIDEAAYAEIRKVILD
ncbi:MAG: CerR family C-terminal domain-containing protein, partial [Alphaproteobacteria bacterium]|nr:CerR family C-terminal domain-containing protein [Alphaproteobacteria bacterium]